MKYKISKYIQSIICFCLICIATTILIFSYVSYNKASHKIIDFQNDNINTLYFRVTDTYGKEGQQSLSDFFSESDSLERMIQFCDSMNRIYDFVEFDKQALMLRDELNYKDEFRADFGTGSFGVNDDIGISLKSVQIGETAYNMLALENQIYKGDGFKDESYIYDGKKAIDAIVGDGYSDILKIGDFITVNYLSKDIKIEVKGFFQKNASVVINNEPIFLNTYIAIPFVDISTDFEFVVDNDDKFQKILYSLKAWGYIRADNGANYYDYRNKVDEISRELDLKYVLNEGYLYDSIKNTANTLSSVNGIFLIVAIVLAVLLSLTFILIYMWDFNKRKSDYFVHLICGCSITKLKARLFTRVSVTFAASFVTAATINKIIFDSKSLYVYDKFILNNSILHIFWLLLVQLVLVILAINIHISRSNICDKSNKQKRESL